MVIVVQPLKLLDSGERNLGSDCLGYLKKEARITASRSIVLCLAI